MTERHTPTTYHTRYRPNLRTHPPALVPNEIRIRRIGQSASSGITSKSPDRNQTRGRYQRKLPGLPPIDHDIFQPFRSIRIGNRHIPKLHKTTDNVPPIRSTNARDPQAKTKPQHNRDLGRHHPLQDVVDLSTHDHRKCDRKQAGISQRYDQP